MTLVYYVRKETNKGLVVTSLDLLMRTPVARSVESLKGDMTQEIRFPCSRYGNIL